MSGLASLPDEIAKEVIGFGGVFAKSAIRVTEGRGQVPWKDDETKLVQALQTHVHFPPGWMIGSGAIQAGKVEGRAVMPLDEEQKLGKILRPTCFEIGVLRFLSARTELAMLPCIHWVQSGTMMVAVWVPGPDPPQDAVSLASPSKCRPLAEKRK